MPPQTRPRTADASPAEKSFLTHAVIYGLGAIALQAASVVLVPLYTRYLSPAEFGVLEMLNRIGEVFSICLLANGIRLAAFTFYCQGKDEQDRRTTAATVLFAPAVILLGSGLVAAVLAPSLGGLAGVHNSWLLVVAIVLVMLEGTTVVPLVLLQARMESTYYVGVTGAMFCLRIVLTVAVVAGLGWGIWGVLGASGVTSLLFGVFLTWREFRQSSFRPDLKKLREILAFCWPFLPAGLCGMVLHNGDRFFLMNYCGADEVGRYALGYKLVVAVVMLSTDPLRQVWTVRMFQAFELPDASIFVGRVCTRILAVLVFASMGLCIFDQAFIGIIASPSYHDAVRVVGPVALAYFFWCAANLMDAVFWVRRRSGLKSWILLASCAVTLSLYAGLIPRYGAMGAAYATLGGMMTHCGITFVVSQRLFRVHYESGRLCAMLGLSLALTITAECMADDVPNLVTKVILWMSFPIILWTGGIVSEEEKAMFRSMTLRCVALAQQVLRWSPQTAAEQALSGSWTSSAESRERLADTCPKQATGRKAGANGKLTIAELRDATGGLPLPCPSRNIDRLVPQIRRTIMDRLGAEWAVTIDSCEPERVSLRSYSSVVFFQLAGQQWQKRVVAKITAHHPANQRVVDVQNQAVVEYQILGRLFENFRAVAGCSVPRPLLVMPEIEAYVMEFVEGELLSHQSRHARWLASRGEFQALERRDFLCGRWLKHFQQVTGAAAGGRDALASVVQCCDEVLQRVTREDRGRCPAGLRDLCLRLLEGQLARVREGDVPLCGCHGDFGPWNMLATKEGLTVIDFLGYGEKPLPLDVLGILVFLEDESCYLTSSGRRVGALRKSFLEGYGKVRAMSRPVLVICEAIQRLISIATHLLQKPQSLHHRLDRHRVMMKHLAWFQGSDERKLLWPSEEVLCGSPAMDAPHDR